MSRQEYEGLLEIARQQVPFGVYAAERGNYAELLNERCESMTALKRIKRTLRANGFKTLANEGA